MKRALSIKLTFWIITALKKRQLFEGGTRVDVTPGMLVKAEIDYGCVACNNGIPMADGMPGRHASGADCTRPAESPDAAPLASAAVMGVGTHQAKRKPRADKSTVN